MSRTRPILFSGPMVRSIFAGLKLETRRPLKDQVAARTFDGRLLGMLRCPYGDTGDRLWVRESFQTADRVWEDGSSAEVCYRADGLWYLDSGVPESQSAPRKPAPSWRPSIFMPRHLCRLVLSVESSHIDYLSNITVAGIRREGLECDGDETDGIPCDVPCRDDECPRLHEMWRTGWDAMYSGRRPEFTVARDPLVWVVKFSVLDADGGRL